MSECYYWNDIAKQVIITEGANYWGDAEMVGALGMYCFDSNCIAPELRYGMFSRDVPCWHSVAINQFPAEFRAYLLLIT